MTFHSTQHFTFDRWMVLRAAAVVAGLLFASYSMAQRTGGAGRSGEAENRTRPDSRSERNPSSRAIPSAEGLPTWNNPPEIAHDLFTFVRVQFDSRGGRGGGFGGWSNDYPDCDLNFSFRLQQLTSYRVSPEGKTISLTDPSLFQYPFIFMTNAGSIDLSDTEQAALRRYLDLGGFLMADDFWAAAEWDHLRQTMRQVLPDREPRELTLDHPIFHMVYDLKTLPQVPSIRAWQRGMTYEDWHGPFTNGDTSPHFWGYFDDNNRLMALFCHNNDIADGWEREGENEEYFARYSYKVSYPLGINIVTYAMSH